MDRAENQSFCNNYQYVSRCRNRGGGEIAPMRDPGTGYVAAVPNLRMSYQPSRHPLPVGALADGWATTIPTITFRTIQRQ